MWLGIRLNLGLVAYYSNIVNCPYLQIHVTRKIKCCLLFQLNVLFKLIGLS